MKKKIVESTIDQLLEWDVIQKSKSLLRYSVVLVNQHGKCWFCVYYGN